MTPEPNRPDEREAAEAAALAEFTEYFVKNYPGPRTIIGDPKWHAPRIFRAAKHALAELLRRDAPREGASVEAVAWTWMERQYNGTGRVKGDDRWELQIGFGVPQYQNAATWIREARPLVYGTAPDRAPREGGEAEHVGDTSFESWLSEYNDAGTVPKQRLRDAYWAGYREGAAHRPQPAGETCPDCNGNGGSGTASDGSGMYARECLTCEGTGDASPPSDAVGALVAATNTLLVDIESLSGHACECSPEDRWGPAVVCSGCKARAAIAAALGSRPVVDGAEVRSDEAALSRPKIWRVLLDNGPALYFEAWPAANRGRVEKWDGERWTLPNSSDEQIEQLRADVAKYHAMAMDRVVVEQALICAAEEIEQGHPWITAVAASIIIRKHAAKLTAALRAPEQPS